MPSPTSCLGQREDLLDPLLGQDRATGGDPADHRHVDRGRHGVADPGLVVRRLLGVADRAAGGHHLGQEHLEGAGAVGVALEEALLLQHPQLVGDRGGAGQADQLADLAHARRVAAVLEGVADDVEDALLARGQAGGVGRSVGELGDLVGAARGHRGAFR